MTIEEYIARREALKKKYIETGDNQVFIELMNMDRRTGVRNENDKLAADINTAIGK
jgi:hypothetical protein